VSLLNRWRDPALRNIAVYGLATALAAVLTLMQTRVLWRTLTPEDFGIWALVDPMLLPAASLILGGIDHAIVKQLRIDRLPLPVVTGTLLVSTLPVTGLTLLVIGLVASLLLHLGWAGALLLTMAGEALILMMQSAFRATGAVANFSAILLSRNLLYLAILLVAQAQAGVGYAGAGYAEAGHAGAGYAGAARLPIETVFLARGGCVILVSLIALAALRPVPRFDWARYRDAVYYGFPLLMTTFIYALTDMTDRWFLARFSGVVAVGVYALHLKVAAILSQAIVIPFGLWFPPERFKRLDDADGGAGFFIRTAAALLLVCFYLSGTVWLARDLVLPLIAPGVVASPLVLALCLGGVICLALSQALNVGLLMPGHTSKNAICSTFAAGMTVLAAAIAVPLFGMDGAATTRLFGGMVLVSATAAWSHRVFPIAFPFVEMLLYGVVSVIAAIGIDQATTALGLWPRVISGLIAWTAVTAVCAAVGWIRLRAAERRTRLQPSAS
jgi:O-antigen/teichoic acid export membrane protein